MMRRFPRRWALAASLAFVTTAARAQDLPSSLPLFPSLPATPASADHTPAPESSTPAPAATATDTAATGPDLSIDLSDAVPVPDLVNVTDRSLLAEQFLLLTQSALGQWGQTTAPTAAQWQVGRTLLHQALTLSDQDPELWRLQVELCRQTGDRAGEQAALARYCALVPGDDAAQWDLVQAGLADQQTVEARLAMLTRLLDSPAAEHLSPALRSRLACAAALAAREAGDQARFARRLAQAAQWDDTNLQAMQIIADLVRQRGGTPLEQGIALLGLIKADPLQPAHRRALADLLVAQGAYDPAAGQYRAAQTLGGGTWDVPFYQAWVTSLIISGHLTEALQILDELDTKLTAASAPTTSTSTATASGSPGASGGTSGDTSGGGLPPALELLRAAAYEAQNEIESARQSLRRLPPAASAPAASTTEPPAAAAPVGFSPGELAWLHVALGRQAPAAALVEELRRTRGDDDELLHRLMGWEALRQNNAPAALTLLAPLAQEDAAAAIGWARTLGPTQASLWMPRLRAVLQQWPVGLTAVLAAQEMKHAGEINPADATGLALTRQIRQWPTALANPRPADQPYLAFLVREDQPQAYFLEPLSLHLSVRNFTGMSLATAPAGAFPDKVFIYLEPRLMGRGVPDLPPLVVDLRRQLVVPARGAVELTVRLDRSVLGPFLNRNPMERISVGGQAALDPRSVQSDGVVVGPLGLTTAVLPIQRYGFTLTEPALAQWKQAATAADPAKRLRALAWLSIAVGRLSGNAGARVLVDQLTDFLSAQAAHADPLTQAWMACFLTSSPHGERTLQAIHGLLAQSQDPLVRQAYLAAQISDPDAPELDAAAHDPHPAIADFARAWREALTTLRAPSTPAAPAPAPAATTPPRAGQP